MSEIDCTIYEMESYKYEIWHKYLWNCIFMYEIGITTVMLRIWIIYYWNWILNIWFWPRKPVCGNRVITNWTAGKFTSWSGNVEHKLAVSLVSHGSRLICPHMVSLCVTLQVNCRPHDLIFQDDCLEATRCGEALPLLLAAATTLQTDGLCGAEPALAKRGLRWWWCSRSRACCFWC